MQCYKGPPLEAVENIGSNRRELKTMLTAVACIISLMYTARVLLSLRHLFDHIRQISSESAQADGQGAIYLLCTFLGELIINSSQKCTIFMAIFVEESKFQAYSKITFSCIDELFWSNHLNSLVFHRIFR